MATGGESRGARERADAGAWASAGRLLLSGDGDARDGTTLSSTTSEHVSWYMVMERRASRWGALRDGAAGLRVMLAVTRLLNSCISAALRLGRVVHGSWGQIGLRLRSKVIVN